MTQEIEVGIADAKTDVGEIYPIPSSAEVGMIRLEYDHPRPVVAYLSAGFDFNAGFQSTALSGEAFIIEDPNTDPASPELWLFCKAKIGLQNSLFEAHFDLPAGRVVQLACSCKSLVVTGRLIQATDTAYGIARAQRNLIYDPPPTTTGGHPIRPWVGGPNNRQIPRICAVAGEGVGVSNLTRRARVRIPAGLNPGIFMPIPSGASSFRVIGSPVPPAITYTIQYPGVPIPPFIGPFTAPTDDEFPIPEGAAFIHVNSTAQNICEIVFRHGIAGDPST
jgi:hypothetical protein